MVYESQVEQQGEYASGTPIANLPTGDLLLGYIIAPPSGEIQYVAQLRYEYYNDGGLKLIDCRWTVYAVSGMSGMVMWTYTVELASGTFPINELLSLMLCLADYEHQMLAADNYVVLWTSYKGITVLDAGSGSFLWSSTEILSNQAGPALLAIGTNYDVIIGMISCSYF